MIKLKKKNVSRKKNRGKLSGSLKNKDKTVFPTLRLIISAIKDFKIASKLREQSLKDQDVISILKKMIKQRNDLVGSLLKSRKRGSFKKRKDEINIINEFLPKQLSEEETNKICDEMIKKIGASSMKDMGKVIGILKKEHGNVLDFSIVSKIIKDKLK